GGELGELVQAGLVLAPVVGRPPVLGELLQVAEGHPAGPADARQLVGPAGARQPVPQVVELCLGDVDRERPNLVGGIGSLRHRVLFRSQPRAFAYAVPERPMSFRTKNLTQEDTVMARQSNEGLLQEVLLASRAMQNAADALDDAVGEYLGLNRTDLICLDILD